MHPNAELIHRFYTAFGGRDHETMAGCYHDDAVFGDPVFLRRQAGGALEKFIAKEAATTD